MHLDPNTDYVIIGTSPQRHTSMSVNDIITVRLCEPGGPEFTIRIKLTALAPDGRFEGVTITFGNDQSPQRIGGSFVQQSGGPDLHMLIPRQGK